jgi:hypothetical protein
VNRFQFMTCSPLTRKRYRDQYAQTLPFSAWDGQHGMGGIPSGVRGLTKAEDVP